MQDLFGAKTSPRDRVWDDDPFVTDVLMQVNNRFATITENDEYEDYINPDTRRRNTTRAPLFFKILDNHTDLVGGPLDNEAELDHLAMNHGTSPDLARQYNAAGPADRELIAQGVGAALDWGATATPVQLSAQRKAAEKVNAYKLAGKAPTLGVDYTDFGGLSAYEADAFFNGTPETRQAIAGKLNTEMQPWNAPNDAPTSNEHVPTLGDALAQTASDGATDLGGEAKDWIRKVSKTGLTETLLGTGERFLRQFTPTRYGNFGGLYWSNGIRDPYAKVSPTDLIDESGKNILAPIDVLDAKFMNHDIAEFDADQLEKIGKIAEAKNLRRNSDLKFVAELKLLLKSHRSGDLKLGIKGQGFDDRIQVLKVDAAVSAEDIMENAILFFTIRAALTLPRNTNWRRGQIPSNTPL